ncbi:hypothetical protein [Paenarthrobacter sp. CAP02]|uniref:hypothetical protein n=1 Tax=Paenarthrobacter sp. CAP02 TaxID=3158144 RepID=UPI0032DA2D37
MTATSIPALLEPIQNRLEVITPGKWFREYSDVIISDPDPRDVEEGYDDPRSMRIVRAAPHLNKREPQGIKNADFIANAPTDTARLLAAVKAALDVCQEFDDVAAANSGVPETKSFQSNRIRGVIEAALRGAGV